MDKQFSQSGSSFEQGVVGVFRLFDNTSSEIFTEEYYVPLGFMKNLIGGENSEDYSKSRKIDEDDDYMVSDIMELYGSVKGPAASADFNKEIQEAWRLHSEDVLKNG